MNNSLLLHLGAASYLYAYAEDYEFTGEPTGTPQTSLDDLNSGNKFEPGETATQQNSGHSPPLTIAMQSATPSPPATGVESPTERGGGTSGGGTTGGGTSGGGTTGGGTTGGGTTGGGTSSSNNEGGGPS